MIKKLLIILCGIVVMAIGTGLCNYTHFGIDPFNAFCIGASNQLNLSLGIFTLFAQVIIAVLILCNNKKYLGIGSIIPMLTFGYILQLINIIISFLLPATMPLIINILLFMIGILFITFGMSLYMNCDLGMVPYDSISFTIGDSIKKSPFMLRMILDITVAILAYLIGGPIQIGTIFIAFGIGPILDFMKSITRRLIK